MSFFTYISQKQPRLTDPSHREILLDGIINDKLIFLNDPYKNQFWSGAELRILEEKLSADLARIQKDIKQKILLKFNRTSYEDWMTSACEDEIKKNKVLQVYINLITAIKDIMPHQGWLVYWAW